LSVKEQTSRGHQNVRQVESAVCDVSTTTSRNVSDRGAESRSAKEQMC
jgi:hypothetical protein